MNTTHTPGPWTVEIEDHAAPSNSFAANVYSGEPWNGTYSSVARVPQPDPVWSDERRAEVEADARLIAAAPDLLAQLREVDVALQFWLETYGDVPNDGMVRLLGDVRASILKATRGAS